MPIKPDEIATLVEMFEASQWDELHVELDGLHLFLSTDPNARLAHGPETASPSVAPIVATAPSAAPRAALTAAPKAKESVAAGEAPPHWLAVAAPNLGTFYRAPKPGAAPFVEVGQKVDDTTELCLLEVMKLFTSVKAGASGIVRRICVEDSDMVEFGQTLFYIEPV